jgi:hypothetical protein
VDPVPDPLLQVYVTNENYTQGILALESCEPLLVKSLVDKDHYADATNKTARLYQQLTQSNTVNIFACNICLNHRGRMHVRVTVRSVKWVHVWSKAVPVTAMMVQL